MGLCSVPSVCVYVKLVSDSCFEVSLDGTVSWCTAVTWVLTALKEQEFDGIQCMRVSVQHAIAAVFL